VILLASAGREVGYQVALMLDEFLLFKCSYLPYIVVPVQKHLYFFLVENG
jgi:hypothetical protein